MNTRTNYDYKYRWKSSNIVNFSRPAPRILDSNAVSCAFALPRAAASVLALPQTKPVCPASPTAFAGLVGISSAFQSVCVNAYYLILCLFSRVNRDSGAIVYIHHCTIN